MNINVAEASFSISRLIASNLRVNQQIAPQPSPARVGGGVTLTLSQKKLGSVIMSWRPGAPPCQGTRRMLQIWAINAQKWVKIDSSTQHIILYLPLGTGTGGAPVVATPGR